MSETTTHRCQWLRQPHTLAALEQPGMSDGDKRAAVDRHQCREVAAWGVGDPAGRFALSCPGHLASWPLWKENPRHPLHEERDDLALTIREAMHDLGGSVPQTTKGCIQSVKEMARALGKYMAATRGLRSGAPDERAVERRDPPPAWFGGPLLDWLGIVYEQTGQRGIDSLTVSKSLGMRLGLAPGEYMVLDGVRIDSVPAEPRIQINRVEVAAKDLDRWIEDMDAMIIKRRPGS